MFTCVRILAASLSTVVFRRPPPPLPPPNGRSSTAFLFPPTEEGATALLPIAASHLSRTRLSHTPVAVALPDPPVNLKAVGVMRSVCATWREKGHNEARNLNDHCACCVPTVCQDPQIYAQILSRYPKSLINPLSKCQLSKHILPVSCTPLKSINAVITTTTSSAKWGNGLHMYVPCGGNPLNTDHRIAGDALVTLAICSLHPESVALSRL